jgi:ABC-type branched-subunit amino acid transport system substrate-binding protein
LSALLGIVSGLVAVSSTPAVASTKSPFSFVVIADFSGPESFIGQSLGPMASLSCQEINNAGGVMGHPCHYVTVDDKSDPADGAIALRQALASTSNVVAVSGLASATGGAEIPIAISAKLLTETGSGATTYIHPVQALGKNGAKLFYTVYQPDILFGYALALAAKDEGLHHPAVVATDGPDTTATLQGLAAGLKSLGVKPAITLKVAAGQSSYGTEVQRLQASHPDGIIPQLTDSQSFGTFMSNYVAAAGQLKIPLITDATILQPDFYSAVKDVLSVHALSAYVHSVVFQAPTPNPTLRSLDNLFTTKKLGPAAAVTAFAPFYDGWILMALAMDEAHSLNPSVFAPYVAEVGGVGNPAGQTIVATYAQGVKAISEGKHVTYTGSTYTMSWNSQHVRVPPYAVDGVKIENGSPTPTSGPVISSQALSKIFK